MLTILLLYYPFYFSSLWLASFLSYGRLVGMAQILILEKSELLLTVPGSNLTPAIVHLPKYWVAFKKNLIFCSLKVEKNLYNQTQELILRVKEKVDSPAQS